jgi:hypothetical protein
MQQTRLGSLIESLLNIVIGAAKKFMRTVFEEKTGINK